MNIIIILTLIISIYLIYEPLYMASYGINENRPLMLIKYGLSFGLGFILLFSVYCYFALQLDWFIPKEWQKDISQGAHGYLARFYFGLTASAHMWTTTYYRIVKNLKANHPKIYPIVEKRLFKHLEHDMKRASDN